MSPANIIATVKIIADLQLALDGERQDKERKE